MSPRFYISAVAQEQANGVCVTSHDSHVEDRPPVQSNTVGELAAQLQARKVHSAETTLGETLVVGAYSVVESRRSVCHPQGSLCFAHEGPHPCEPVQRTTVLSLRAFALPLLGCGFPGPRKNICLYPRQVII